jgi:hypothetical protein
MAPDRLMCSNSDDLTAADAAMFTFNGKGANAIGGLDAVAPAQPFG